MNFQFPVPVSTRTIYTIGLGGTNGTSMIAQTKLLTPIVQTPTDVLDVYYSLTVSPY
jgi:hypothetical protein